MTPAPRKAAPKAKSGAAKVRRTGPQVRGKATVRKADWRRPRADRVARLRGRLRQVYGVPVERPHGDPIG